MRRLGLVSVVCCALAASLGMTAGVASAKPAGPSFKCPKGFHKVKKTVRKRGKKRVVFHCRKLPVATTGPVIPGPAAPPVTPVAAPVPTAKLLSTTQLGAVYENVPPARLGSTEFRIGQYTLNGSVSPFAVPDLRCFGAADCVEPTGSLAGGSLAVPLLARLEYVKQSPVWTAGVAPPAGKPSWITLPELATGSRYFQATGAPDPLNYLPSSARAPIQITSPHLPGTPHHEGEWNDPTITETFQELGIVGTYVKLGGADYDLVVESIESPSPTSSAGCRFQVRYSNIAPSGGTEWASGYAESVFPSLPAGSKQIQVWVRHEGGEANCGLTSNDTYVITERPHT